MKRTFFKKNLIKILILFLGAGFALFWILYTLPRLNSDEVLISDFNKKPCFSYGDISDNSPAEEGFDYIQVMDANGNMQWHVLLTSSTNVDEKRSCLKYGVSEGVETLHEPVEIKADTAYGVAIGSSKELNPLFKSGYFCQLQDGTIIQISSAAALVTPFKCRSQDAYGLSDLKF
jgi:hypothetical protein